MGLIRRNPNAAFEKAPETSAAAAPATAAAPAPAATAAAAPPPPPPPVQHSGAASANVQTTVAGVAMVRHEARTGALSSHVMPQGSALDELKDVFSVEYDTFERLKSGSGNIVDNDNHDLGQTIAMTVLSWQDAWDVSPGSDAPEAKKVVKFSDNGVTIKGSDMLIKEYLDLLRAGDVDGVKYPNAAAKQKMILVGVLNGASKETNLLGKTVQVSLSDKSKNSFNRHRFDWTVQTKLGKRASYAGAENIIITATPKSSNGRNYTLLIVDEDKDANKQAA